MPGRGWNKNEIKSVRTEKHNVYRNSKDQKIKRNMRERLHRRDDEIAALRGMTKSLTKMNELLTKQGLASASPKFLRAASKIVLQDALDEKGQRPWSPVSIALAQFEQEYCSLNMAGVEIMRNIEKGAKYKRKTMPARATIQNFKRDVAAAGAKLYTKPKLSDVKDIVHLDAKSIIEAVLVESEWPGVTIEPNSCTAEQLKELVSALPPLMVDATADGAELTESRGMIVEGIKFVSPEIVNKLSPPKLAVHTRSTPSATAATAATAAPTTTHSTEDERMGSRIPSEAEDGLASNLDDLVLESAPTTPLLPDGVSESMSVSSAESAPSTPVSDASDDLRVEPSADTAVTSTDEEVVVTGVTGAAGGSVPEPAQVEEAVREDELELAYGVQSCRAVLLTGFCHGGDNDIVNNEHNYNRLSRGLFTYMQEQSRQPFRHSNGKYYNVQICLCLDKKALQALSGLGCGSFMNTFICTYCPSTGNDKHTKSYYRCNFCKTNYDDNWPCVHQEMLTHKDIMFACALPETHPVMSIILKRYSSAAAIPVNILRAHVVDRLRISSNSAGKSISKCTKDELADVISNFWVLYEVNVENIDIVHESIVRMQLACRLPHHDNEVAFREIFGVSTNTSGRELLRAVLYHAQRLEAARRSLRSDGAAETSNSINTVGGDYVNTDRPSSVLDTTNEAATQKMYKVVNTPEICMPCFLHCDMRSSEKLLSLLMERGIQRRDDITQNVKLVIVRRLEKVISSLLSGGNGIVSETHEHFTSVFELPSIAPGERIAVRMSGARLHKLFTTQNNAYARMIDAVFDSPNTNNSNSSSGVNNNTRLNLLRAQFHSIFAEYIYIFTTLRTTHLFTNSELDALQLRIDKFCYLYTSAFGGTSITNYIHDLQSGHIMYFLRTYRSLYIHCNIGVEASIRCTTSHIMRGTQRGGHGGAKGKKYSIVQSISDYFNRSVGQEARFYYCYYYYR